jgi:hypothetical protein
MFADKMKDSFIYELLNKIDRAKLKKLIIRKAIKLTELPFEYLFNKPLPALEILNLDECVQITDAIAMLIGGNCRNLKRLSLSWIANIRDVGV